MPNSVHVVGFIPIVPFSPGFVTPVFRVNGLPMIQQVVDHSLVGLTVIPLDERIIDVPQFPMKTAGELVYGFYVSENNIIFDTKLGLARFLRTALPSFSERKALCRSIEAFVDGINGLESVEREQSQAPSAAVGILPGWSDQRIERLKKLWAEGWAASQIAATLGGVSRNSVISAVHRLGLGPRRKPRDVRSWRKRGPNTGGNKAAILVELAAPNSLNVALRSLDAKMCHWPVGDPLTDDFRFCGIATKDNTPYCLYHQRLAYQPKALRSANDEPQALSEQSRVVRLKKRYAGT